MNILTYNQTTTIDKECKPRHNNCHGHVVGIERTWGTQLMSRENMACSRIPKIIHFIKTAPCMRPHCTEKLIQNDPYQHYQVHDHIVSMSKQCAESSPCCHTFLLDGKMIDWDVGTAADFFRDYHYFPPVHILKYSNAPPLALFPDNEDY